MNKILDAARLYSTYDIGMRSYMVRVFVLMAFALIVTGVSSYFTFESGLIERFYTKDGITAVGWLVTLAPLALVFFIAPQISSMDLNSSRLMLALYSAVMGMSLSNIFLAYAEIEIIRVFFITAALFLAMSVYGYLTKRDLTSMRSFMMMGLVGIILASVVNIFLDSPAIYFIVSITSIFVFMGLIAYDMQKLKDTFDHRALEKASLMGALILYMDVINLFLNILHVFAKKKNH